MMFIVRRRQFALMMVGFVLLAALIGGGAWLTLRAERGELESSITRSAIEKARLLRENKTIKVQREVLSRRLAMLERSAQVKSRAYAQVDAQLNELQREILELKEDIAFYRGIVSEDSNGNRVQLQRLVLERDGGPQDYLFRLVLTRGKQDDKVTNGVLLLSVDGEQDGERVRLTLEQLSTFPVTKLQFSFKHFQRLEGRLHLPERFVPKRVVIKVELANSKTKPLRESFAWSVENS
ncbi:MAG: hypothetical protein ACI9DC_002699 [Gammaproteobacteria bacterium]|jgi:hypothetical protein